MTLRDLLLRTYPRAWRDEYGPEMAGILAHKRLTPALVANVLASSVRQNLHPDPWKICALGLAMWTSGLILGAREGLVPASDFVFWYVAGQLFLFAASGWTVLRKNSGIWMATASSFKAALVPDATCVLIASVNMLRYWGLSNPVHGHSVHYWILKNLVISFLVVLLFGLAGASLARIVNRFSRFAQ